MLIYLFLLFKVLAWLKNCCKFYETCIVSPGGVAQKADSAEFVHLCDKICQMVTDKLSADVSGFLKEDLLLSHIIDEVILFSKEVQDKVEIADRLPIASLPISVLAYDKIFAR